MTFVSTAYSWPSFTPRLAHSPVNSFRRTLAAHSQRQRVPRQYAMSVMGWSTTAMLDRYTQWMQEEEREAIEAFQELDPYA